jgi:hypothetical protein
LTVAELSPPRPALLRVRVELDKLAERATLTSALLRISAIGTEKLPLNPFLPLS